MAIKCVAFHSYKGGTGKTTIASNCAALLAKKGYKVALLDLDIYAPSLLAYFERQPRKWLNDYLVGEAEVDEIMTDVTDIVQDYARKYNDVVQINGKLWIGFCNMKKEEIYKIESSTSESSKSQLRRFILLREQLISEYGLEYVIIDTSPGVRYWSINALAVANTLLLTLKMGDIDIEGTKRLASEIYGSLTKYGTKSFLLFNRVAGYCMPSHKEQHSDSQNRRISDISDQSDLLIDTGIDSAESIVSKETSIDRISSIPCYCDIQFSRKEFLTALKYPEHPFAKEMESLVDAMATKF